MPFTVERLKPVIEGHGRETHLPAQVLILLEPVKAGVEQEADVDAFDDPLQEQRCIFRSLGEGLKEPAFLPCRPS